VTGFAPPAAAGDGVRVRWDSAVEVGFRIPPHYDSLVGKLIVHAPDRPRAIEAARAALGSLRIEGVKTTAPLLRDVLGHERFVAGDYDVSFLASSGLLRS